MNDHGIALLRHRTIARRHLFKVQATLLNIDAILRCAFARGILTSRTILTGRAALLRLLTSLSSHYHSL